VAASPASPDLLARLKELRKAVAAEIGKPAFVVFSDASLIDMAEKRPVNIHEFRLVNGVGDHKARLYSERFLQVVRAFIAERGLDG
jgi:ATP-dependent DNA helicase RecQ